MSMSNLAKLAGEIAAPVEQDRQHIWLRHYASPGKPRLSSQLSFAGCMGVAAWEWDDALAHNSADSLSLLVSRAIS
jgi:hypothetical protein